MDVRFLSLISAAREVVSQVESDILISTMPSTISLLFSKWAMVLDANFPITHVGSVQASQTTPSIIMAELIRSLLQKCRFLTAAKRAGQLPNSLTLERITTQEVCKGLKRKGFNKITFFTGLYRTVGAV